MKLERLVQEFLERRRLAYFQPDEFIHAVRALQAQPAEAVRATFDALIAQSDTDDRAEVLAGFTHFFGTEATPTVFHWIRDVSPTVRWTVCECLHDRGDRRARAALEERLTRDPEALVRGAAARALGRLGGLETLPHLWGAEQHDHESDSQGHTPASRATDAISELLRRAVIRQIQGRTVREFEEIEQGIRLSGRIVAEAIPFDEQGRIGQTPRYAHLPMKRFGPGWGTTLDLQTQLISPFEIEVAAVGPSGHAERVFVFQILDSPDMNLAVSTLLMKSVPMVPAAESV